MVFLRGSVAGLLLLSSLHRSVIATPILGVVGDILGPILGPILSPSDACKEIAKHISDQSALFWPGSTGYIADTYHWATSSSDVSACSVEPGIPEDVAIILYIVGNSSTPFAVKGGGHASNPGFSSTKGVHISMTRFNKVIYDPSTQTADIGSGLVWDDVYAALEPYGVNVVGGRVTGVGVAGFTLGGGYSFLTNQYGLTIDTVVEFELVQGDGTIKSVNQDSDPELFFSLKGGFNNFGIVTSFKLKTFPQGQCWGGIILFTQDSLPELLEATARFSAEVKDPKASIITTINSLQATVLNAPGAVLLMFYDGPTVPAGVFDDFLAIKAFSKNVKTRSFLDIVKASPASATNNNRGAFHTVPTGKYSLKFLNAVWNQTIFYGKKYGLASSFFMSYDIEPFLDGAFKQGAESAYPPDRQTMFLPTNLYFAWLLSVSDDLMRSVIDESKRFLEQLAIAEVPAVAGASAYGNYALSGTTSVEDIYGQAHLDRMRKVRERVDPNKVMALAGGWKI